MPLTPGRYTWTGETVLTDDMEIFWGHVTGKPQQKVSKRVSLRPYGGILEIVPGHVEK